MPTIAPKQFHRPTSKKVFTRGVPAPSAGFSLVELVCVLAGVTLLTSIAATTIENNFVEFENDETQAHLNSAANECLRALGNLKSPEKYNSKNLKKALS